MPFASRWPRLPDGAEGMSEEEWHFVVDVNLTEAFTGCRALGPHLLERGSGNVINISGFASFRGRAGSAAYDAAKAGLMRFTESLAQEWAPYGVRVNCVAPGYFPDPAQMSAEAYRGPAGAGDEAGAAGARRRFEGTGLSLRVSRLARGVVYYGADVGGGRRGQHHVALTGVRAHYHQRRR